MIAIVPATEDRGAEIRLPWPPPPIALMYRWGCYWIRTPYGEAKSTDPFDVLTLIGMTHKQAHSAMAAAKGSPGELLTFEWRAVTACNV